MRDDFRRASLSVPLDAATSGGNADYALYGLSTPAVNFTLILARQEDPAALPDAHEPLPKDAAEYAFADIYPTNPAEPAE